jgi:WD40 repeat protein
MQTFEITIQRKAGSTWPVVVLQAASGVFLPTRREGVLELDPAELIAAPDPFEYGRTLGEALFRGPVRDAFVEAAARGDGPLHMLLFVEDASLRTLRWERLCGPQEDRWDFLRLRQDTPFSLYLPAATDSRFPYLARSDLRALIVVASPPRGNAFGLDPFDAGRTSSGVRLALGPIPCDVLSTAPGAVGPPTLDELCERITAERYTLLHVVGHGRAGRDGEESLLYLLKRDGGVDPVTGARLIERLSRLRGARGLPHLAFLCCCESASPEADGALGGIGQRLVRELGLPAVIAMADRVTVATSEALAARFYERLGAHGSVDLALNEACAGLAERGDITVPALYSRLGGRTLFDDEAARVLTNSQVIRGLDRVAQLLPERVPILASAFEAAARTLRGVATGGAEPEELSPEARREHDLALAAVEGLCLESFDLGFAALARGKEPPPYDARCPFPGLLPFHEGADGKQEFFFGREALVGELKGRLAAARFLAVLGPSGSGKSSVVRAGLLRELRGEEPDLRVVVFTPTRDPVGELSRALAGAGGDPELIVVDQFEELFTLCTSEAQRREFLDALLPLRARMRVVLTMRADFLGDCASYASLRALVEGHQKLVGPMDAAELRRAMEQQCGAVGLRFEAGLGGEIVDDVQGEPGAMPLLQHALLQLWNRRHGRWLKVDEYRDPDKVGGLKQAIARTADAIFAAASPAERELMPFVFVRLARIDTDAEQPERRRDTRRREPLADLTPVGGDRELTRKLVTRLADAKLLVTTTDPQTQETFVEVAHEALIRHWKRLRNWLDEARQSERLIDRIRDAADAWLESGGDPSHLPLRGGALLEAEALLATGGRRLTEAEARFIHACRADEDQRAAARGRLRRNIIVGLAAGLIVALGLASFAAWQRGRAIDLAQQKGKLATNLDVANKGLEKALGEAEARRLEAERKSRIALARQLTAQAGAEFNASSVRALLLAAAAVEATGPGEVPEPAAEQVLRDLLGQVGGYPIGDASGGRRTLLALSGDRRWVLTSGPGADLLLWDMMAPAPLASKVVLPGVGAAQDLAAFDPQSRWLFLGSQRRDPSAAIGGYFLVDLCRAATPQGLIQIPSTSAKAVERAQFSADGTWLLLGPDFVYGGRAPFHLLKLDGDVPSVIAQDLGLENRDGQHIEHASFAFSPDRSWLVAYNSFDTLLWDLRPAHPTDTPRVLGRGGNPVNGSVAFSPDGRWLAAHGDDNLPKAWDLKADRPEAAMIPLPNGGDRDQNQMVFSPDGRWLLVEPCLLWRLGAGTIAGEPIRLDKTSGINRHIGIWEFVGDGARLLWSGDAQWVAWDLTAPDPAAARIEWEGPVELSPGARWLVHYPGDGPARLWDLAAHAPAAAAGGVVLPGGPVCTATFTPDARALALGYYKDGSIRLHDLSSPGPAAEDRLLRSGDAAPRVLQFSPGGRWLLAFQGGTAPQLFPVRAEGPTTFHRLEHLPADVLSPNSPSHFGFTFVFSPDESSLVGSGGSYKSPGVFRWDLNARDVAASMAPLRGYEESVPVPDFVGPGHWLLTTSFDNGTGFDPRLWDLRNPRAGGLPYDLTPTGGQAIGVQFSPDSRWLAALSGPGALDLWEIGSDQTRPISTAETGDGPVAGGDAVYPEFSPDGHWLLASTKAGGLHLYDLTGTPPVPRALLGAGPGHTSGARVFSPGGRWLVTAPKDCTHLWIWDLSGGTPPFRHAEIPTLWSDCRFRSEGELVVLAPREKTTRVLVCDLSRGLPAAGLPARAGGPAGRRHPQPGWALGLLPAGTIPRPGDEAIAPDRARSAAPWGRLAVPVQPRRPMAGPDEVRPGPSPDSCPGATG